MGVYEDEVVVVGVLIGRVEFRWVESISYRLRDVFRRFCLGVIGFLV